MIEKSNNGKIKIIKYPNFNNKYWTQILGWEDYFIHQDGFIKSIKIKINQRTRTQTTIEKILSMFLVNGYIAVNLIKTKNGKETRKLKTIHRLIAEHFIPKVKGKFHVNHINGIKHDSNISNLEWCTPSENEQHSFKILGKVTGGISKRLIRLDQISIIKERYSNGETQKKIANDYNVNPSIISNIIREKNYTKHLDREYIK